jgi:trimeric autotransporter adhesin
MKSYRSASVLSVAVLCLGSWQVAAQESTSGVMGETVPHVVSFSGVLRDSLSHPVTKMAGVTFSIYKDQEGGPPLWLETQNVRPDAGGHYTVQLGATSAHGFPADIFTSGNGRWLAVQIGTEPEQPRVLLVAVPYAVKAADADTIGGLPPSAFVLAAPTASGGPVPATTRSDSGSTAFTLPPASTVTTNGGTLNTIPLFTSATNIGNSILTQTSTTAINVRGNLIFPATGTATASKGFPSQPENFIASVFNSASSSAVNQQFRWLSEPAGNNTANASGTINLLYGSGSTAPSETGLKINNKGIITFAPGQTFSGASGTVTSVGLSAPSSDFTVSGSPVTSAGTLGLKWKIQPTSANVVNAIVKRDSTGSFSANSITASHQILLSSSVNPGISATTSANGGVAIVGEAAGTGLTDGILGSSVGTGTGSAGVIGLDNNAGGGSSYTTGVTGRTLNPRGIGVLAYNGFNGLSNRFLSAAGFQRVGIWGDAQNDPNNETLEGIGVVGTSDTGIAILAENNVGSNFAAMVAQGGDALSGGAFSGADGISTAGGSNSCCDTFSGAGTGGSGIFAVGGPGTPGGSSGGPGVGGSFTGGDSQVSCTGCGGDGIFSLPGLGGDFAGTFLGDIQVAGRIFAGTKDFKIDHPIDPANKYLLHSSVESSEMVNIYSGNVVTDGDGVATVRLPQWFEALNTDFRYQLTVIGVFAQAIVAHKIEYNQFTIRTNLPNVEVSWQVTGVRHDAFARANPLVVEQEKESNMRGFYIHPEYYGASEEKQIEWARHPHLMKRIKDARKKLKQEPGKLAVSVATRP